MAAAAVVALAVAWTVLTARGAERLLEDQVNRLSVALSDTADTQLAMNARNVADAYAFLGDHPEAEDRDDFQPIRGEAEADLLNSLEAALEANDFGPIAHLLAESPSAVDTVARLADHPDANDIVARLGHHLESWIRIPPPVGKAGEIQTCIKALLKMEPESSRATDAIADSEALDATFRPVGPAGFPELDGSIIKRGRVAYVDHPGDRGVPSYFLRLDGDCDNVASLEYPLDETITHGTVSLSLTMDLPEPVGGEPWAEMSAYLLDSSRDTGKAAFVSVMRTTDSLIFRAPGVQIPVARPIPSSEPLDIELRYFAERGTCDVLLNDTIIIEEAPGPSTLTVKAVQVHAEFVSSVNIHRIDVATTDAPLKLPLGQAVPIVLQDDLGLQPIVVYPIDTPSIVVHDFDFDGIPEIAAGSKVEGELSLYHFTRGADELELVATHQFSSVHALIPVAMVGPYLAVTNFRDPAADGTPTQDGFDMIDVSPDWTMTSIPYNRYPSTEPSISPARATFAELRADNGRRMLAVGLAYDERRIDLFELTADGLPLFDQQLPAQPIAQCKIDGDVNSLLPWDCDQDGQDDLLIGWGEAGGVSLLRMKDGRPVGGPNHLSGCLGRTRLASMPLNRPATFVACAAAKGLRCDEGKQTGIWAWRAEQLLAGNKAEAFLHEEGNANAIAVGTLGKEELIAAAVIDIRPDTSRHNLSLRLYRPDTDRTKADLVWETKIAGVPGLDAIQFVDLDGDAVNEFVACVPSFGVYVFAVAKSDA
jgi:hypothetical protein